MPRLALLLSLSGCGPNPVAVCAGNHTGSFSGSDVGTADATLDERGRLEVSMNGVALGHLTGTGEVDKEGALVASGLVTLDGELDLLTCDSFGGWTADAGATGSWTLRLLR